MHKFPVWNICSYHAKAESIVCVLKMCPAIIHLILLWGFVVGGWTRQKMLLSDSTTINHLNGYPYCIVVLLDFLIMVYPSFCCYCKRGAGWKCRGLLPSISNEHIMLLLPMHRLVFFSYVLSRQVRRLQFLLSIWWSFQCSISRSHNRNQPFGDSISHNSSLKLLVTRA